MNQYFKLKKVTKYKDLVDGNETTLPFSDLAIELENEIIQFQAVTENAQLNKIKVKPGIYTMSTVDKGVDLLKTKINKTEILKTLSNTQTIISEIDSFFNNLSVYDKLNQPKKRSILLYGPPGCSKTTSINLAIERAIKQDKGTSVIIWPTGLIHAETVAQLFGHGFEYDKKTTRIILIAEDIGGSVEGNYSPRTTNSGLLNLLDGVGVSFEKPTFVIATTNYPENLAETLADRPGRFDKLVEMNPPATKQKLEALEFIAKRSLTQEERDVFANKQTEDFSLAHLKEIVIRSMLHNKSIKEIVEELIEHKEKFKTAFSKKESKFGF